MEGSSLQDKTIGFTFRPDSSFQREYDKTHLQVPREPRGLWTSGYSWPTVCPTRKCSEQRAGSSYVWDKGKNMSVMENTLTVSTCTDMWTKKGMTLRRKNYTVLLPYDIVHNKPWLMLCLHWVHEVSTTLVLTTIQFKKVANIQIVADRWE